MKKNVIILGILILSLGMTACSNWLDVKPKKTVEEEELFSREIGFKEALTGAYIKMTKKGLYGRDLTYGFIDILGQRYQNANSGSESFQSELYYTFPSSVTESTTTDIWENMYNIIADLNNLLYWVDKNKTVFSTPGYYEIIKGEALGLRAFLHFDLLRMFGPVYQENPEKESICYRTVFSRESAQLLSAKTVTDSIIADLGRAEALLTGSDPLLFDFPQQSYEADEMEGDPFLVYRHKRMNLYAVKAMLARICLYARHEDKAAQYAHEVIDSKIFEPISDNSVDRIFSKEIIFSIYIDKFADQVANQFMNGSYKITERKFLEEMFNVAKDGANDIRMREGVGFDYDAFAIGTRKFKQDNMWVSTENTIPLIRLPEMYYILAECEKDYRKSADYLNIIREARGVDVTSYDSPAVKLTEIEKEYRKEFYGEGQLFYFYKRNFYPTFLHCPIGKMTEANYRFSLPENEVLFGKTN